MLVKQGLIHEFLEEGGHMEMLILQFCTSEVSKS